MKILTRLFIFLLILVILIFGSIYFLLFYLVNYNHEPYMQIIEKYAQEYNVDAKLVTAIVKTESDFKEDAVSSVGAIGLMQLMPDTGEWIANRLDEEFEEENLYNPDTNIKYGVYYFDYLFNHFKSLDYAILAYNGGLTNVELWMEEGILTGNVEDYDKIPFNETRNYIMKVKKQYRLNDLIYDVYYKDNTSSKWKKAWNLYKTLLLEIIK